MVTAMLSFLCIDSVTDARIASQGVDSPSKSWLLQVESPGCLVPKTLLLKSDAVVKMIKDKKKKKPNRTTEDKK